MQKKHSLIQHQQQQQQTNNETRRQQRKKIGVRKIPIEMAIYEEICFNLHNFISIRDK